MKGMNNEMEEAEWLIEVLISKRWQISALCQREGNSPRSYPLSFCIEQFRLIDRRRNGIPIEDYRLRNIHAANEIIPAWILIK